jgi:copper chaperone CopZ
MKNSISVVALVLTIGLSFFANTAFAVTSIRAEVKGMVCAFCAKGISKKLNALSQSKEVFVDLKNRIVAVEFKDQQTLALDEFNKIINDAGYDVAKAEFVEKSVADIKAELAAIEAKK